MTATPAYSQGTLSQTTAGDAPISLEFSDKYDRDHALQYYDKHSDSLARRLSNWREQQLARQCLEDAGNPDTVLDLPCGAGRFWPMLAENTHRQIYAADNSGDMLQVALTHQPDYLADRIIPFKTSAFAIDMPDASVDSIFCMRLLHHIASPEHRLAILREFHRVTRDTVVVSLWVDGNYKSWRRKKLEAKRGKLTGDHTNQNRFIVARKEIESEFHAAGFEIINHRDFLMGYAMWRMYIIRKANNNE
ncbi:MAG: class I SAM-dependent methyltransferase, partial [Gammaproteobacteria bacterium]